MKALWNVYIYGRYGKERELGLVVASANDFNWIRKTSYISCDQIQNIGSGNSGIIFYQQDPWNLIK